jgi:hypothetical protein
MQLGMAAVPPSSAVVVELETVAPASTGDTRPPSSVEPPPQSPRRVQSSKERHSAVLH